ncbi:protein CrdC [Vitiosangium sp. GDMCC 1.1324]|uniref:protein CrdC n=1 Tax=Vitiosangium sp. (strain GDMCC 1.1324) TaxID=2138576 RepID=UPI000D3BFFFC|nr:protein CrdC [Vitiosangium sp. GDMCC 1.1324]PTL78744.1 protein CrdC [Vitiosangium sp. GDMCC 1.1324]
MVTGHRSITGLLLCRAGAHRVAFAAHEVATIESPSTFGGLAGCASQAFGGACGAERILVAATGEAVGVDALEIDPEPMALLPAPGVLAQVAGGSLSGFVQVRGALWPLMSLAGFGRFLAPSAREAA